MVCNSKVESDNAGGRQCPSFQRNQINKAGVKSSVRPGKAAMQPAIDLEELEAKLGQHENDLLEMNTNSEKLLQTWCNAGEGISDDNDASASSSQVVYLFGGGLEGRKWKAAMRLHKGADFQSWDEEEKSLRYTCEVHILKCVVSLYYLAMLAKDDKHVSQGNENLRSQIALKTKELEHAENERVMLELAMKNKEINYLQNFLCNPNLLVLSSYVMYGRNYQRRKKGNAVAQSTAREGRVCC
uniref:Uncharacterized protein n=1 Tax=Leersia perrieri TaxID=77586 RepID=A0A0D9WEY7_9ORYZ